MHVISHPDLVISSVEDTNHESPCPIFVQWPSTKISELSFEPPKNNANIDF